MLYPITVDVLHQVFSPHGFVEKIVTFQKSAGQLLQVLSFFYFCFPFFSLSFSLSRTISSLTRTLRLNRLTCWERLSRCSILLWAMGYISLYMKLHVLSVRRWFLLGFTICYLWFERVLPMLCAFCFSLAPVSSECGCSIGFQALIQYQSRQSAVNARELLQVSSSIRK